MRILVATVTAGGGHVQAAAALEEAWKAARPRDEVNLRRGRRARAGVRREDCIFFPSLGIPTQDGRWEVEVHAWCFRIRPRGIVVPLVRKLLGFEKIRLTPGQKQSGTRRESEQTSPSRARC